MEMSANIDALAAALSKAQGKITGALKDSKNPFFKSSYADLASCWDACRAQLSENGLAVIQTTASDDQAVIVTTLLAHTSGQWIKDRLRLHPKDDGPQAMGSCITYGRRYGLAAIVGLAQVDDDAEAATGRNPGRSADNRVTHLVGFPAGESSDTSLSNEKRDLYLPRVIECLEAGDRMGFIQLINELTEGERKGLWFFFSTKQKAKAREMMQSRPENGHATAT